jgi:tricorn protease
VEQPSQTCQTHPAARTALAALLALAGTAAASAGTVDLPRYPAASPDGNVLLFSWRGDLWKVPASGGAAVRLTALPSSEGRSAFSPDGSTIVFDSDRDGSRNLYAMKSDGSAVRQLTFGDSACILAGTGLDGAGRPVAYFESSRENDLYRAARPYMVPLAGGPVERVTDAFGSHPLASADGKTVILERGGSAWFRRGYQGPDQRDVWSLDRASGKWTRHTDWAGNDGWAFPAGADIVYLTDRGDGKTVNAWRKSVSAPAADGGTQLTNFPEDVRELAVSADGRVAFVTAWDAIHRVDLAKPGAQPVKLAIQGTEDEADRVRPRGVGRDVSEAQLSPDGKSIALVAYGDVYVKGMEERSPFVRVTATPGREREIAWMPDGSKLLFVSDMGGEDSIYEATVTSTRGELRSAFKDALNPKKEEPKKEEPKPEEPKPEAPKPAEPTVEQPKPAEPAAPPASAPAADPAAQPAPAADPAAPAPAPAAPAPAPEEPRKDEPKPDEPKKDEPKKEEPKKEEPKKDEGARWADAVRVVVKPFIADAAVSERSPSPSPDGTRVAYRRDVRTLVVRDVAAGTDKELRTGFDQGIDWRWSPDGRMIAFRQDDEDFNSDIWIVPADGSSAPVNVSRHPDADANPRWSSDGKVMAFASTRVDNEADIHLVFLDKSLEGMGRFELDQYFKEAGEAAKKRAAPKGAEARKPDARKGDGKDEKKDEAKKEEPKKDEAKKEEPKPLDLEDAHLRLRRLTTMPGNEMDLEISPAGDRVYFMGSGGGGGGPPALAALMDSGGLMSVPWSGGEAKKIGPSGSIQHMTVAGDKLVIVARGGASVVGLPGGDAKPVEFSDTIELDLAAQSDAKFREAARIMGEIFYSPTMNGCDWPKLTEKWAKLASNARTDEEFDYVANRFLGELNASHLGVRSPGGGEPTRFPVGQLGIETKAVQGGFEVRSILRDGPATKGQTPLAVGDVIVAVNGEAVRPTTSIEECLRGTVGRETVVRIRRVPAAGGDALELDAILVPGSGGEMRALAYEDTLRANRELVDRLSGGRIGYIHIASMDQPSLDAYERDLYAAAAGKDGLLVDVRNNGGGWTADRLLASIMIPPHAYTVPRGADPSRKGHYPVDRLFIQRYSQPMSMLCNEKSFSNAEITAHAFKTLKRGTLVGIQTYGGVISTGSASLVDGTTVRTPFRGWYLPDGTDMELHGAMPDIVVPQTPEDECAGKDAQVEAAVKELMGRLR